MLTSENGIRESHSGQKYERIDIPNRKLTKVCLTAPMASHLEEILSGEDKQGDASPSLMAPSDFIADGFSMKARTASLWSIIAARECAVARGAQSRCAAVGRSHVLGFVSWALIASGGFTKTSADAAIQAGMVDAIAFGRAFIANSDLPHRLVGCGRSMRVGSLCDAADRNVVCDLRRGLDYRSLDQLETVLRMRPVKITKKDPCLHVRTNPFLVVFPARCNAELDREGRKHR